MTVPTNFSGLSRVITSPLGGQKTVQQSDSLPRSDSRNLFSAEKSPQRVFSRSKFKLISHRTSAAAILKVQISILTFMLSGVCLSAHSFYLVGEFRLFSLTDFVRFPPHVRAHIFTPRRLSRFWRMPKNLIRSENEKKKYTRKRSQHAGATEREGDRESAERRQRK